MATLWKHENGIWYLTWWDAEAGRARRKSTGTRDYEEARAQLADFRLDMDHGVGLARSSTDLEPFARAFLKHQRQNRHPKHVANQTRQVGEFIAACRSPTVEGVRMEHVERFLDGLRLRGLSGRTVNQYRGTLRRLFTRAQKRRLILTNPVDLVDRDPEDRPEGDFLARAEFDLALATTETRTGHDFPGRPHPVRPALALGGLAGLRRGEIVTLRWEDTDLERNELTVRNGKGPRGRKDRVVEIGARLRGILETTEQRGVYVCMHRTRRTKLGPWTGAALSNAVRDVGIAAGVPKLNGPQILRRSFGSWLAAMGVPLLDITRIMGHSSYGVTERSYIRFVPGRRLREVDDL